MIFTKWETILADLMSEYGIDAGDYGQMRRRSWRTVRAAIVGLFAADTRIGRWLNPQAGGTSTSTRGAPVDW